MVRSLVIGRSFRGESINGCAQTSFNNLPRIEHSIVAVLLRQLMKRKRSDPIAIIEDSPPSRK
jgi:hypothetical protein